jgi:hypothetical protein
MIKGIIIRMGWDVDDLKRFAQETDAFVEELKNESDRGAALIGAAFFDELLKQLFENRMVQPQTGKEREERKKLFAGNGPLHDFAGRLRLAHSLGLAQK